MSWTWQMHAGDDGHVVADPAAVPIPNTAIRLSAGTLRAIADMTIAKEHAAIPRPISTPAVR